MVTVVGGEDGGVLSSSSSIKTTFHAAVSHDWCTSREPLRASYSTIWEGAHTPFTWWSHVLYLVFSGTLDIALLMCGFQKYDGYERGGIKSNFIR